MFQFEPNSWTHQGDRSVLPSEPRGCRYLMIKELGLKDHDHYGFWGLSP